jgi:site-specific recombinase XerD
MPITPNSRASQSSQCSVRPLSQYLSSSQCDEKVRKYIEASHADNTVRAYQADLKHFIQWGGTIPETAERVAAYLAQYATTHSVSTLTRRLVAIGHAHTTGCHVSPTASELVRATMQGIRRSIGSTQRQVAPLQKSDLLQMVRGLKGLRGLRDRAILLVGFSAALRRSELVSLDMSDVQFTAEGLLIRLRHSKTDQEGRGRTIAIPNARGRHSPNRALMDWIEASGISEGALFRRISRADNVLPERLAGQSVALIIKARASQAGLESDRLSGHSLRAGFVTNAAKNGASSSSIRRQTGHQSDAMLHRYIRGIGLFAENPNSKIW